MTDIKQRHDADVRTIQSNMRMFFSQHKKVTVYHGSTNSTRAYRFDGDTVIDVSRLNRIIEIRAGEKAVLVEPNVPMDRLVEATLAKGLVPPVVMEFPGITVGGGIQGGAGESSSFKYGLFHDACVEYEMVLGNGDVVTVSPQRHADLFYGTACSYGSLGVMTLVKMRLVPAQEFVHLVYRPVASFEEAIDTIHNAINERIDFVDGIMFSKNSGVVMIGNFSDRQELPLSTFHQRLDEWFYIHAKHRLKHGNEYEEIVPTADYLFRYDRGGFWVGRFGFKLLRIPFIKLFRMLLDGIFHTRTLFRILHATNLSQRYLVQDVSVPRENAVRFLEFVDRRLGVYPLWLCPLKPDVRSKLSPNYIATDMVVNVGVWGEADRPYSRFVAMNRELETAAADLRGRKVLYAHQYYPRDEFWNVYDRTWYQTLRKKYFAESAFPDVFEKTFVSGEYRPTVFAGIRTLIASRFKRPAL